ncbi:MAG: glycosyltransferase family 1 protein [Verrucomicrobiota bacterium]
MKQPLKIDFVTDTYRPQANGVATTLHRLVNGLRDRGHKVDVIRPATLACEESGMKVPSVALPGYREVRIGLPMGLILQSRWQRNRPDVIYVATETPLGASAITAARTLKIPAASGFHTNFQKYAEHYRLPMLGKATLKYLRYIHNRSDRTFVPSDDAIAELEKVGFKNLELLPKGVDTAHFNPKKRSGLLRAKWGATEKATVGIYVGRIAPEKNLPLVIRTFQELQRRYPDFKGVLVGDGPVRGEYIKEYPELIFTGTKSGEELAQHYASADLFLFPSMTETFGNVTLEAMACRLPVVTFDYAAGRQHIVNGENGFTVPYGDEDAFVESALNALSNRDLQKVRDKARCSARQVRWKRVVKRFEKSLVHMIHEGGGGGEKEKTEVPDDFYDDIERWIDQNTARKSELAL